MCLLIAKPYGARIKDIDDLCASASDTHPDGFGYAFVGKKGNIVTYRGMIESDKQSKMIESIGDAPAIIHWRFSTGGTKTVDNCHPFVLPDKTVFAHNGILPYQTTATKSDTRLVAECAIDLTDLRRLVDMHIGTGNKVAFLRPKADSPVILGEEFGTWRRDVWYSNLSHEWSMFNGSLDFDEDWRTLDERIAALVMEYGLDDVIEAANRADEENRLV